MNEHQMYKLKKPLSRKKTHTSKKSKKEKEKICVWALDVGDLILGGCFINKLYIL